MLRSDTLTQVLQGYKYPLKTHTEFFLHSMDTHIHAHYNNPSDTSEQWHITPAAVFKFSRGAAAGGDGTVSPPDATHVILACHPCQLNFNTLGRMWAEKQRSSWQTASSDPTFTANLPVKAVIHRQNILRFLNVYASLRQGCRLWQESMSPSFFIIVVFFWGNGVLMGADRLIFAYKPLIYVFKRYPDLF